jgi:hypothetical protein
MDSKYLVGAFVDIRNVSSDDSVRRQYQVAVALYVLVAVVSGLGLLGKLYLLQRVATIPAPVIKAIVLVWVILPLGCLIALRLRRFAGPLVLVGVVIASLFIYPRMEGLKKAGRGSDQPDCVIVAANGFARGTWPYDVQKLWTHNPMSCGPGWVMLQTPGIEMFGYGWNLVLLWTLASFLFLRGITYESFTGVLTLVGLCIATWVATGDGTDFITFGILAAGLFVAMRRQTRLDWVWWILLVLVAQFRFPMVILPVLLLPFRRIRESVILSLSAFAFQLVFLYWNSAEYISGGPLHLFYKITKMHMLVSGASGAILEVSFIYLVMLALAVGFRKLFVSPWLGLIYLVLLMGLPAIQDFVRKYHEYGSIMPALGLWEGANWLSGCIPFLALYFVLSKQSLKQRPLAID